MKTFNYFLQFFFIVVLFFIFKLLGYNFSTKLSGYIFLLIGPIFGSNKTILKNLDIAFPKINSNEKDTMLGVFDNLINNKFSVSALLTPKVSDFLSTGNYDSLFAMLRGTANRASVFNPYTYSWILKNVFPDGKKLLSPVMSWCTPVIGVANSNYDELVAIDVIPDVVSKAKELHNYSENMRNTFFGDDSKTATFFCCPSEKLDERYNFSETYKEHFDLVFFSPP